MSDEVPFIHAPECLVPDRYTLTSGIYMVEKCRACSAWRVNVLDIDMPHASHQGSWSAVPPQDAA